MDISFALSIAVLIAGLVIYLVVKEGKAVEVGRLMFFAGLLVTLLRFGGHAALHVGN